MILFARLFSTPTTHNYDWCIILEYKVYFNKKSSIYTKINRKKIGRKIDQRKKYSKMSFGRNFALKNVFKGGTEHQGRCFCLKVLNSRKIIKRRKN